MILGGDPQYVFYTAVAAAIYCALCLVRAERRTRIALGLALMCAGAAAITAVQLWTGMEATGGKRARIGRRAVRVRLACSRSRRRIS